MKVRTNGLMPISRPSGMPIRVPMTKPIMIRVKLTTTPAYRSPFSISSNAPSRVFRGEGRKAGLPTHQARAAQTSKAQASEVAKTSMRRNESLPHVRRHHSVRSSARAVSMVHLSHRFHDLLLDHRLYFLAQAQEFIVDF